MNRIAFGGFSIAFLALFGFAFWQNIELQRIKFLKSCSDERSRINNDQLNENIMLMVNDLRYQTIESAKNQGKIEGIIAAVNNMKLDEKNEYSQVWHSGYYAGTSTNEQAIASAYEDGYHKATEDGHCTAKNAPMTTENIIPAANKKDIKPTNKPNEEVKKNIEPAKQEKK